MLGVLALSARIAFASSSVTKVTARYRSGRKGALA
jgi:hypothetical protein